MRAQLPFFIKNGGIIFNLLFALYVIFAGPVIVQMTTQVMEYQQKEFFLGALIFFLILADLIAVYYKAPSIGWRAKKEGKDIWSVMFLMWIGRLCVNSLLGMMALMAVGLFNPEADTDINPIGIIFIFGLVIKELVVLFYMTNYIPWEGSKKYVARSKRELLADLLEFVYVCFGYTIVWQSLSENAPLTEYSSGEMIAQFLAAFMLFFILVMPLRMIYVMEDLLYIKTNKQKIWWWISFFIMITAGMQPLFR